MFFNFCLYFFLSVIVLLGLSSISKLSSRMCFSLAIGLFFFSLIGFIIKWLYISLLFQEITELPTEFPYISESFKKIIELISFIRIPALIGCILFLLFFVLKVRKSKKNDDVESEESLEE